MRATKLLIPTLKEDPADAAVVSHQLMLRAGLIRQVASGIYTWLPLGLRVIRKVEAIVREEMNEIGAQELLLPFVQPGELWKESGRWDVMGPEMLRVNDRHGRDFTLSPTHEEVITDLFRSEVQSYRQLPLNTYQINLKFRDERRPRFGVMRSREFIMMDAYSFDLDQQSFDLTYAAVHGAYDRILTRVGVDFRAVLADTGNMGGSNSHEFQVLAGAGEDLIAFATESNYAANVEKAEALAPTLPRPDPTRELERVPTPGVKTIADLARFLSVATTQTLKTLIVAGDDGLIALVLRGDHELNEVKAGHLDGVEKPLRFATDAEIEGSFGCAPGSLGPVASTLPLYVDRSAFAAADFICGANEDDVHLSGVNWGRDLQIDAARVVDLRNVVEGDPSPDGHGILSLKRGIEVGQIFQLGTHYTELMQAQVLDQNGVSVSPFMGCYGIGITRLVAAVIEQRHDDAGITWPQSVAPFSVHILGLNYTKSEAVRMVADELYQACLEQGLDVLLDDRDERPGAKFADADLIGIPHRLVIGDRNLKTDQIEYRHRADTATVLIDRAETMEHLLAAVSASDEAS
jgi:prolyl-tRNA synthetase